MFSKTKAVAKTSDAKAPADDHPLDHDEPGAYLANHDTPQTEKRHTHAINKVAIAVAGISLALNCVMAVAITQLLPLYKVVPLFVTFSDKAEQVVSIQPPNASMNSLEILTDANVRDYVLGRHTISDDPQETISRWGGKIHVMSTPQVYDAFLKETQPIYTSMKEHNFTRSIRIISVLKIVPGLYRVEWEATDRRIGAGLADGGEDKHLYVSELRIANLPISVRYEDRFLNPLGFTVTNYSAAPKKSTSN
jgi:type IV secretion system protein VirB8